MLADAALESGLVEIESCFDTASESRDRFAQEIGCRPATTLDDLLDDRGLDAVLIATPHTTHPGLIEDIAAAGKHIFVEKPLALTVAGARRAIAAADAAHVVLQVGHGRRRQSANRVMKKLLESGELGGLLQLVATFTSPNALIANLPEWRLDPVESPAGSMTALGVHMVDTFHYLAGRATRVAALSKQVVGLKPIDDSTVVMIEFEGGPLGLLNTSYFVPQVVTIAVYGTDGAIWNEDDGRRLFKQRMSEATRTEHEIAPLNMIHDELQEFVRCAREGGQPETGGPEGLEVAAVLEAVVMSVQSGRVVELSQIR